MFMTEKCVKLYFGRPESQTLKTEQRDISYSFFATGTKLLLKSRLAFICYFVISANRYIVYNHCHCNKKAFVLYELGSLMF